MIRTIVTPEHQDISIHLPENFLGKQVEIIAFTKDELLTESKNHDPVLTHFASEKVLAKDWLSPEEDMAWENL